MVDYFAKDDEQGPLKILSEVVVCRVYLCTVGKSALHIHNHENQCRLKKYKYVKMKIWL